MPICGSPNGARHPRPQPGRDPPEQVVAINRNGWSQSIGIAGRDHPVRARWSIQEIRRIAMKLAQRRIRPARVIAWSLWRRAHQAEARAAHLKRKMQL